MRAAGLPAGYATALETGLWPGCDVLPPAELARRGQPLRGSGCAGGTTNDRAGRHRRRPAPGRASPIRW